MHNQHVKTSLRAIMAAMVLSFALVACNNGSEPTTPAADTAKPAPVTVDTTAAMKADSGAMKMDTTKKDTAGTKPVVTK